MSLSIIAGKSCGEKSFNLEKSIWYVARTERRSCETMRFPIKFLRKDLLLTCFVLLYLSLFSILPNIYLGVVAASTEATVSMDPSTVEANPGESFTADINVADVVDLYSWGIKIRWDRDLLDAIDVTEGPFLKGQPDGTTFVKKIYDGYIDVGCSTLMTWPGVNGNGTLMTVSFNVTDTGGTTLEIYYSKLLDSATPPVEISHTVEDGNFHTTLPYASFTWAPGPPDSYGHPLVDEIVTFNASASYDPDGGSIVSYEWDFGDDTAGTGVIATHVYDVAGEYIVELTVTDDEGETDTQASDPNLPKGDPNLPIVIRLHDLAVVDVAVVPENVLANETVRIYVTVMNNGSHPTDPTKQDAELFNVTLYYFDYTWHLISTYEKTLKCDPGKNVTTGVGAVYLNPFIWNTTGVAPGSYTIWAYAYLIDPTKKFLHGLEENTANNARSSSPVSVAASVEHDIAITGVTVTPTEVKVGETVEIDVRVENEGTVGETFSVNVYNGTTLIETQDATLVAGAERILHVSWFEATNTTAQSTYNVSAQVPPVVNETDVADNVFMNVIGTIQLLPVAYFTFSPSAPISGRAVAFDASASYAPGIPTKTIDSYSWDFGDGTNATGVAVTHVYDTIGTFSVTLTVIDSDDLSNTLERSLIVYEPHEAISTINMSLSEIKIMRGEGTTISGSIASTLPGVTVTIWHRVFAETWDTLAIVITDENGQYSYEWKPRAAETYEVKASWQSDGAPEADESEVQVIVVQEGSTLDIFLYSTVALAVLWVATVVIFLRVRKPKPK